MATVYKLEIEIVSDWVNYTEEEISKIIKNQIEKARISEIRVSELIVKSRT